MEVKVLGQPYDHGVGKNSRPGPYLGTLRPWAQEIFTPPPLPYLFVFS